MTGYAIIDNVTLTAAQRIFDEIPIYNKHVIDADILSFETLIKSILFFHEVCYINNALRCLKRTAYQQQNFLAHVFDVWKAKFTEETFR